MVVFIFSELIRTHLVNRYPCVIMIAHVNERGGILIKVLVKLTSLKELCKHIVCFDVVSSALFNVFFLNSFMTHI